MMMQPVTIPQGQTLDLPLDGSQPSFWMPVDAAAGAADIDFAFNFILAICTFFFVLIVGLGILFVIKYRKRPGYTPKPSPHHSLKLEITWSVIPVFLCVFMFWFGFSSYMHGRTMPEDAEQIGVIAQKWSWSFQYSNGATHPELHVPVGEPVVLTMRSNDVIHSLFIPAFRTKLDVVPGRYSKVWFEPTKEGEYQLFCTEYCGTEHSSMQAKVYVETREEYEAWLVKIDVNVDSFETLAEAGKWVFETKLGCNACHLVDGTTKVGPPLNNVFGSMRELEGAESVLADENYIRDSMLEPGKHIAKGYANNMTSFQGRTNDKQIDAVIAYLKELAE